MDAGTVAALSPIRHIPDQTDAHLILSVGGLERDGFLRETQAYGDAWSAKGHRLHRVEMAAYNHFDITSTLTEADGALVTATLAAIAELS